MSRRPLATGIALALLPALLGLVRAADAPTRRGFSAELEHWSFRPLGRPAVPAVRDKSWVRTPIDAFILARLEKNNLRPAPPADRRTLLRRVYFDLIGLPPTLAETAAFLADRSPQAYARVVDDLLARPQHGERWARHWLDVARYAETNGYERDGAKPHAWRYRDYVIDALNKDVPYDCFLTEQLAGDEMPGSNARMQIATTFLRLGTWDDEPADPVVDRYDQLDDVLGTTATAFMGVTLRCARCHDHKFDPFSQKDYYRMLAVFEPLKRPQNDRGDLDRLVGTEEELKAYRTRVAPIEAQAAALAKNVADLKQTIRARLLSAARQKTAGPGAKRTSLPPEAATAFQTEPPKRTPRQQLLVKKFAGKLEREIRSAADPEESARWRELERQIQAARAARLPEPPRAYVWYEDSPRAPVTRVFKRGDAHKPIAEVSPGLPGVLVRRPPASPRPLAHSTGRRLWLARWLTNPDHPLVARVMVNRVWQWHFGAGLVPTANDFGMMGEEPSHPELLDWLAAEFVAKAWSVKHLHRLIVLSSTYRMAAAANPAASRADPADRLLWRWPQRRLQAEAVRDAILAVSGRLNPRMGGPSVYPPIPRAVLEGQSRPGDGWGKSSPREAARRSIYIFVKRVLAVPELELLDAPDTTCSCEQRLVSTTAPQALTFLNGAFMHEQAGHFASRLEAEASKEPAAQVRRAFELAFSRSPTSREQKLSLDFLGAQRRQIAADVAAGKTRGGDIPHKALEAFCLVVLNINEFVYLN
jgi:hypothetical protein